MKWYAYFMATVLGACAMLTSCSESTIDNGDNTPDVEPVISKLTADNSQINMAVSMMDNEANSICHAITKRTNTSYVHNENQPMLHVVMQSNMAKNMNKVAAAYEKGDYIMVVNSDYKQIHSLFQNNNISVNLPQDGKMLLSVFNRNGNMYDMDNPFDNHDEEDEDFSEEYLVSSASKDYKDYLNPLVNFINDMQKDSEKVLQTSNGATEPADVAKTFDAQKVEHTYNIHLRKKIAHVALSSPDYVEANSQLTLRFEIYPLHAFDDQASPGDYYLVNCHSTIQNAPMYMGSFTRKHGGVKTHIMAYMLKNYNLKMAFDGNITPTFDRTPQPQTTAVNMSHTEGVSWNIGGSLTGGVTGGKPTGTLTINAGATYNNSNTVTYPDLIITNRYNNSDVNYEYEVPADMNGYMQGFDVFHDPSAPVVKGNADMYASWVWRVEQAKDNSKDSYMVNITPNLSYKAMHYFTSVADGEVKGFNDAISDDQKSFKLCLMPPSRIPTGTWNLKNTFENGVYVTDVKVYNSNDTDLKNPIYENSTSMFSGDMLNYILPVGKYIATFRAGKSSTEMKNYKSARTINIERAGTTISNSGLDLEFITY